MNTIIALRGIGDSGKSTTIRILHGILIPQSGYRQVRSNFQVNGRDFVAVFEKNGKLIGVTSSGDKFDLVFDALNDLVNAGCEESVSLSVGVLRCFETEF